MSDHDPNDPALRCRLPVPPGSDFPLQNLPYGVFRTPGRTPRAGVAIGTHVLDLAAAGDAGLLDGVPGLRPGVFSAASLNRFLALGRPVWQATRRRVSSLLVDGGPPLPGGVLVPIDAVELLLPVEVGDYVDFYSSLHHASNLGRLFRPGADPLLPNWRHLPVAYHGRSGTVAVSGTPVVRPRGQYLDDDGRPVLGPTRMLDLELEVGFVTGAGPPRGTAVATAAAEEHVFGLLLVNDWSARDLQRWESQPLGPFLGKSFATSVSPWLVALDALRPYRVAGPPQDPPVLDYLRCEEPWGFDLRLEVEVDGGVVSRTNARDLYWNLAQQLAHATVNGATVRPGDLFASGTVSGPDPGTEGSLVELTGGAGPFLADGSTVVLRGHCGGDAPDRPRIGFGEVRGTILPPVAS